RIPDPSYGAGEEARVAASIPPAFPFRAHNSPLGIAFVRSTDVPADYRGAALVALHGSWNRTRKDGYKVVSLHWDENGEITERDFLSGFLLDEDVIGRPVDVAEGPDGAFYISDDHAGVIWRVAYGGAPADAARFALPAREEIGDDLAALSRQERIERSARGEELYRRAACATCHEPERAEAGAVIVPLEDLALRYDVAGLDAFLVAPTPPMPAFPFDREERRDIAVYLLQTR
ncbi:MAG: oxidoreductase, partial [Proteobacteria bacterium]|nr:oxidoreductase [Pseudomonadota bacterium]